MRWKRPTTGDPSGSDDTDAYSEGDDGSDLDHDYGNGGRDAVGAIAQVAELPWSAGQTVCSPLGGRHLVNSGTGQREGFCFCLYLMCA